MIKKILRKDNGIKVRFLNGKYQTFKSLIDLVDYIVKPSNDEKRAIKKLFGNDKPYNYKDLEAYM